MSAFQHFPLGRGEAMGMLVDFYNLANGTRFERRPETFWNRRIGRLIKSAGEIFFAWRQRTINFRGSKLPACFVIPGHLAMVVSPAIIDHVLQVFRTALSVMMCPRRCGRSSAGSCMHFLLRGSKGVQIVRSFLGENAAVRELCLFKVRTEGLAAGGFGPMARESTQMKNPARTGESLRGVVPSSALRPGYPMSDNRYYVKYDKSRRNSAPNAGLC